MIQRIQTLYLLIAALLMGLMTWLPTARFEVGGEAFRLTAFGIESVACSAAAVAETSLWVRIWVILAGFLAWVAISLYKRRRAQMRLCMVEIGVLLALQVYVVLRLVQVGEQAAHQMQYLLPALFPVIAAILTYLAYRTIRRDEALVRSIDRVR